MCEWATSDFKILLDDLINLYYFVVVMGDSTSLGEFEQVVLLAILRLGDSAYGVSIRTEIESCVNRKTSPGALYTTLERLEQKGLVVARSGEPTPERGGRAKRFYKVTKDGRGRIVDAQSAFRRLLAGLDLLGETHG
jgi:PadR family transcriptional regulator PadR